MRLETLFDLSEPSITTAEYLKQRTTKNSLRQRLLVIISHFIHNKKIPENLLVATSEEAIQKNTARWLKKSKGAFFDELTNTLHTQTINAIKQHTQPEEREALIELQEDIEQAFDQIQETLETPPSTQIDPTVLQLILENPLAFMTDKEAGSFNTEIFCHCEKYLQLLLITAESIQEIQQLNLIMQYLHKEEPRARAYIQELYDLYDKYLDSWDKEFLKTANCAQDPTLEKKDQENELDAFEKKIEVERFKKIHRNPFVKQYLAQKTTPEHTALAILFFELARKDMEEFGQSLLNDMKTLRQKHNLPKKITFDFNQLAPCDDVNPAPHSPPKILHR